VIGSAGAAAAIQNFLMRAELFTSFDTSLATVQAAYFGLTGIWPIVHMRSFLAVTGPKHDLWLVRTVGLLILAVALPLAMAAWRGTVVPEVFALAVASSAALAIIDVVYVARGTIRKVYLADAAAELVLLAAWGLAWGAR
jgi:hypothetical protein